MVFTRHHYAKLVVTTVALYFVVLAVSLYLVYEGSIPMAYQSVFLDITLGFGGLGFAEFLGFLWKVGELKSGTDMNSSIAIISK